MTQKASANAAGEESALAESGSGAGVVVAEATASDPKTATITPVTVSGGVTDDNKGKVTEINQDTLTEYAVANDIEKVEIITGLSATTAPGGEAAPQTIIKDDAGNTVFEAVARGGQLRMDKKMDGVNASTIVVGSTATKEEKAAAINYVDVRLQFKFKLPAGVNIEDTVWSWNVKYNSVNKTVNGVNYLPVSGEDNTYTSNVVVTNVPLGSVGTDFKATLSITYTLDGVTYTITQSDEAPLSRAINQLVDYYKNEPVWSGLDLATKNYIDALIAKMS